MELVKANDENSFDPTSKLKSSPLPILFVSFNRDDQNCFHCGNEYTKTLFYFQKYCKKCLSQYITDTAGNNTYLDMCIYTMKLECNEHEMSRNKEPLIQNIQEWCENCSEISYFKQITPYLSNYYDLGGQIDIKSKLFKSEMDCKLCGKLVHQNSSSQEFEVCSNCYLISSEWIKSSLTKNPIPVLRLPWWDGRKFCIICDYELISISESSDCQKYCKNCYIFCIGCRYCLTTNIIFGFVDQSQCKKCKRISSIVIDTNISSDNYFLHNLIFNTYAANLWLTKIVEETNDPQSTINAFKRYTIYPSLLKTSPI